MKRPIMKATEIRSELLHKIDLLNGHQLKEVYGLIENYFNNTSYIDEWEAAPQKLKDNIETGIQQANMGLTIPLSEVTDKLRRKYSLNA